MENMSSEAMNMYTVFLFRIDVSRDMAAPVNDCASFTLFFNLSCKNGAVQARSHN
jgi:hypothetical protein